MPVISLVTIMTGDGLLGIFITYSGDHREAGTFWDWPGNEAEPLMRTWQILLKESTGNGGQQAALMPEPITTRGPRSLPAHKAPLCKLEKCLAWASFGPHWPPWPGSWRRAQAPQMVAPGGPSVVVSSATLAFFVLEWLSRHFWTNRKWQSWQKCVHWSQTNLNCYGVIVTLDLFMNLSQLQFCLYNWNTSTPLRENTHSPGLYMVSYKYGHWHRLKYETTFSEFLIP